MSLRPSGTAAFRHRDFRLMQAARMLAVVGTQMQSVAIGWQVYDATRRPIDLGYVGLAQFIPGVGLALVTGHVADRFDRRRILLAYYGVMTVCSAALCALAAGPTATRPIYAVLFIIGVARAFAGPASQALLPHVVPLEDYPNAVAWSSSVWQLASIVGPALGGLAYGAATGGGEHGSRAGLFHGAGVVYAFSALACAISMLLMAGVRTRTGGLDTRATTLRTLFAGVEYVWSKRVVLGAISLDLFAVLLGGAVALLPAFARDILHVGPWGLGFLRSAPAIGATTTAIALAYRPLRRHAGPWMFVCVALFGLATIGFGLSRSFALSLVCLAVAGASDMVSIVVRHVLVQLETPPPMRGRVSAVNLVFIGASNELGEFESGVTAAWFGIVPAVVLGGVGTLVVVALWAWWFPELRQVNRLGDPTHPPPV